MTPARAAAKETTTSLDFRECYNLILAGTYDNVKQLRILVFQERYYCLINGSLSQRAF